MPGKQVKNWNQYHALRKRGFSKSSAARITNASVKRRKGVKKHVMTPARRAALRKAQLTSAHRRRRHGIGSDIRRATKQTIAYAVSSTELLGSRIRSK